MSKIITVQMSTLCAIKSGKSDTQDAVEDGEFAFFDRSKKIKKSSRYLYDCEALIIAGEGAEFLPKHFNGKFDLHQRAYALHNFNQKINVMYLYYYLHYLKDYLPSVAVGATVKSLRLRHFENLPVVLFPITTQQKIVAKLDAIFAEIDTATAAAEAIANNAEALFQSYLTEVFERGGEGWKTLTIKDLIKIRSGDFLPAKNMKVDGVIDVYGGNGISGKHNLHNISGENIVIGRVGAKCGNVRLVNGDIWITDNAFYVSEYKKKLNKEFLALALKQKNLRELAHQMAQPVISFTTIKDAEIKIPDSISIQIKLLEVKNFLESQIEIAYTANVKKVKLFKLLKQSILQKAFSGELVKD
jgi:type I restriction enzyme S subunit